MRTVTITITISLLTVTTSNGGSVVLAPPAVSYMYQLLSIFLHSNLRQVSVVKFSDVRDTDDTSTVRSALSSRVPFEPPFVQRI